jgi:hypothetical protein
MNTKEEIITKLKFYLDKSQAIHITLPNGKFINGQICFPDGIRDDFVMINDFKFGELPVFFCEIEGILPYIIK